MRGPIIAGLCVGVLLTLSGCFATGETDPSATPEPTVTVTVTATPEPTATPTTTPEPTATSTPSPTATSAPGKAKVTIKVTLADIEADLNQLHVGVTMLGISEENGKCVATATKGSAKVSVSQTADYNVNRVECGGLRFDLDDLSSGTWKVTVAYSSPKYEGTSPVESVKVP